MNTRETSGQKPARGLQVFLIVQLLLISGLVAWGSVRAHKLSVDRALPRLRAKPLAVPPLYDYEVVVTDEQLYRVLSKLGLPHKGTDTVIGYVDHSLRFWGPDATFENPDWMSGEEMRRLLTDHDRFVDVYGADQEPLLIDLIEGGGQGVKVRALEGLASSSHTDHTMACLAEVGTPLDFPIVTSERTATFRDIVEESLRYFSINQFEYEWSALTYALLLPPTRSWVTTGGQRVDFDMLAERIMREDLPRGVCLANHRLHALVVFLRVDDQMEAMGQERILSPQVRRDVVDYLQDITAMLVQNMHPDGFWNGDWNKSAPETSEPTDAEGDDLAMRVIATGHVMEWWALAPREIHPPRHVLATVGQWLVRTVDAMTAEELYDNTSFLSHVGRALALWRSRSPIDVIKNPPSDASQEDASGV